MSTSLVKKKLGVAIMGLGQYAEDQVAPALQETRGCYLAGVVTGSPDDAIKWKKKFNIPVKNIYNYENFDSIKDNSDIDILYVALPNSLHQEYTVRAAKAGKHVMCEKPMAITAEDCDKMIAAFKKAGQCYLLATGFTLNRII